MKSLRVRVVFVVVAAALVPVLTMAGWTRWTLNQQAGRLESERIQEAMLSQQRLVESAVTRQQRSLDGVCHTPGLLAQVAGNEPSDVSMDGSRQRRSIHSLRQLTGLDQLVLFQFQGDQARPLLASQTRHGRTRTTPQTLVDLALETSGHPFVVPMKAHAGTHAPDASGALLAFVCKDILAPDQIGLVGVTAIHDLVDPTSEPIAGVRLWVRTAGAPADPSVGRATGFDPSKGHDFFTFRHADATPAVRLAVTSTHKNAAPAVAALDEGFFIAGALALAFAVLLGGVLAWSLARPLTDLEAAAARVGSGDFESTLGVHSDNEIGRALRAFNRMTVDLKSSREQLRQAERIAAWRDIARRIAHEVKNPLLPIQVSIETMQKTFRKRHPEFPEIFEESTAMILDEVGKLDRMVTEFSDFARMPAPTKTSVDVVALTQHVEALWRNAAGYSLEVQLDEGVETLRGDRDQLSDVLTNLLKNAVEAATEAGLKRAPAVRLAVTAAAGGVLFAVHDSGRGIPPAERSRIFEPYVTGKSSGTGLGLSIVKRIVTDHGGTISIRDSPLGGAQFEVFLPYETGTHA